LINFEGRRKKLQNTGFQQGEIWKYDPHTVISSKKKCRWTSSLQTLAKGTIGVTGKP
jgi:hypothetical protein